MRRKFKTILLLVIYLVILFFFIIGPLALAMSSTNYAVPTDTLDQGGVGPLDSTNYKIPKSTLGQTIIGEGSSSNYKLCHGWICGTEDPYISFSLAGVATGTTIAGITTDITTTADTVSFGALLFGSSSEGASLLTVTLNWGSYTVIVQQNQDLTRAGGAQTISPVTAANSSPAAWPAVTTGSRFGYHTTDATLGTGTPGRFAANDTYAKFETTPYEVAYNNGPVSSETTYIIYRVELVNDQTAGNYSNIVNYIITANF